MKTETKTTTKTETKSVVATTYADARTHAKRHRQHIVIFVGKARVRTVKRCVSVHVAALPGYPASCVVVGTPESEWVTTLDEDAPDATIEAVVPISVSSVDALDEVNQARAARGLRPYLRDEGLTQAAQAAAEFRASRGITGHTSNDFAFLPPGSHAPVAGCGALTPDWGWGTCATYESWTYAGAAYVVGDRGVRFMHLFVR